MKLRLIFRQGLIDFEGKFTGWDYSTYDVEIPEGTRPLRMPNADKWPPEVVGAEWQKKPTKEGTE